MENLKEAFATKEAELIKEGKMAKPNRGKMLLAVICQEKYLTNVELCTRMEEFTGIKQTPNNLAGLFTLFFKPALNKPIRFLIQRKKTNGTYSYRMHPEAARLSLHQLHQLSYKVAKGTFTLRDAVKAVPELDEHLKKIKQTRIPEVYKKKSEQTPPEQAPNPSIAGIQLTPGQDININVNISFKPFEILFGVKS